MSVAKGVGFMIKKYARKAGILLLFDIPFVFSFVMNGSGKQYGIGHFQKLMLCMRVIYNNRKIKTISFYHQHIVMIEEIFNIPKDLKGDIVECGCYNGSSTVNLSLAAYLTNRRLFACDSFEGLPEPSVDEKYDINSKRNQYYIWNEGETAADGGLEGVKRTVEKYGKIEVCEFVKGYYKDSLPGITTDAIVLIFEDACLVSSVRDCIVNLWPKLQYGCKFYSHEPWSQNVIALFYDTPFWKNTFHEHIPGFWGSGDGIRVGTRYMQMGYAIKYRPEHIMKDGVKIVHVGLEGSTDMRLRKG